jgi:hypothetical protein
VLVGLRLGRLGGLWPAHIYTRAPGLGRWGAVTDARSGRMPRAAPPLPPTHQAKKSWLGGCARTYVSAIGGSKSNSRRARGPAPVLTASLSASMRAWLSEKFRYPFGRGMAYWHVPSVGTNGFQSLACVRTAHPRPLAPRPPRRDSSVVDAD